MKFKIEEFTDFLTDAKVHEHFPKKRKFALLGVFLDQKDNNTSPIFFTSHNEKKATLIMDKLK